MAAKESATPIGKVKGRLVKFRDGRDGLITIHPSYILRLRDDSKEKEWRRFVSDLRRLAKLAPEVTSRVGSP